MAGLRIKLNANECILINGAIVRNGPKQCCVTIETPGSNILRLKDAIDCAHADTPTRRLWLLAQSIVAGMIDRQKAQQKFVSDLTEFRNSLSDADHSVLGNQALEAAKTGNFYLAMRAVRQLSEFIDPPLTNTLKDPDKLRVEDLISTEC